MRPHAPSLLTLLAALGALAACGHSQRQVSPAFPTHDPQRATLSGDTRIWVTSGDIETPHRQLAVVRTHTYRREVLETEGVAELRSEARRLGADAVVRVQAHPELTEELSYRPGNLFRLGTRWVTVYSLSGVAVKYEEGAPPPAASEREGTHLDLNLPPTP